MYQLPSSFTGGIQQAQETLKNGSLPTLQTSPILKQTVLPQKKVAPVSSYIPITKEKFDLLKSKWFSIDQIVAIEKRRKAQSGTTQEISAIPTTQPSYLDKVKWGLETAQQYANVPITALSGILWGIKTAVTPWEQGIIWRSIDKLKQWYNEINTREQEQGRNPTTALQQLGTVARTWNQIVWDIFQTWTKELLPRPVQQDVAKVTEPVGKVIQAWLNLIPNQDVRDITEAGLNFLPLKVGKVWTKLAKEWVNLERWALEMVRKDAENIALPSIKELGKKQRWTLSWNIVETKWFPFKKQEIVRSPKEALAVEEATRLLQEWKLKNWMSELQKREVVNNEVENLSKSLETNLRSSNISIPKAKVETLFDDLSNTILDNPSIVWDAESALKKLLPQLRKQLTKETYFPEDILQLRKDFDKAITKAKWEWVFDPKLENAFTTAVRDFRQWLNEKVSELVPDAKVKQILDRQSALYTVDKTLSDRWASQANTFAWQILNKVQGITGIPRTEIIEFTTALWLWTVAAPFLAPLSATIWVWFGLKKLSELVASSGNKAKLAKILKKFDEAVINNPWKKVQINNAKTKFINFALYNLSKNGDNTTSDTGDNNP